jgi:phage gp29-like protein
MTLPKLNQAFEKPLPDGRGSETQPDLTEYGATGTPIFGGFLRDAGEYNPTLEGISAFTTYEKMRRSDAQVAATLMGMKLPIRQAEWVIVEPEDATPVEKEAADFVRECLLEEIELDAVIENALLMLDFGCAAHEDVYYIDGNRVRLKKLAPRLPVTFNRWLVAGEELKAIEQYGYAGETYKTVEVPMSKVSLFTFQQEGANYAGRSVLRPMYQHWYIKSNLYKIDAIACERNGMGVPWAVMGENAKAEDRKTAIEWLEKLSAHEKAAILMPFGWTWGLKGVEGTLRDPKDSIAHHNVAISMAGLAQFMMLGQSDSGNRALGQTMGDFFYQSLEATSKKIARVLRLTTIKRLVDFNFAGVERYPRLVAQQILPIKFETIVAALKDLATSGINAVQPDEELEGWLRNKMGAPKAGEPRVRQAAPPLGLSPDVTTKAPSTQSEDGKTPAEDPAALKKTPTAQTQPGNVKADAAAAKAASLAELAVPAANGLQLRRAPRGMEKCLALAEIIGALDKGRDDVAAALRQARSRVQAEIVNKLVNAPVATLHRVSLAPDEKLFAQIDGILRGVSEFGSQQVGQERERQAAGRAPSDAAVIRAAVKKPLRDPLGVYADGVVGEFTNTLTSRAANIALDWMRRPGDLTKGEIIRKVEEELDGQSDKWIDGAASKGANEAFADGRAAGYEEYSDEIGAVLYSALLDWNTCGNCEAADGAEGPTPDAIPDVPNPDCDGGDKCRCVHVYIFADEVRQ